MSATPVQVEPRLVHRILKGLITRVSGGDDEQFVLRVVQPSLVGMIDGTVSTLAPIFAAAV